MDQQKLGEKSQKTRNRRFMTIILSGLVIVTLMVFWIISKANSSMAILKTSYERMKDRRFVIVKVDDQDSGIGFDLQSHEFFSSSHAVKSGKSYGADSWSAAQLYKDWEGFSLTYGVRSISISDQQIRDQDFVLEFPAKEFIDPQKLDKTNRGDIEIEYLKANMEKVRVTFNKDFLPRKLEGYLENKGRMSWKTLRTYSYPFKNKSDFDKKLDEKIQILNEIESEKETE